MGLQGVIGYPGPRGIKVLSTFAYLSIMNGGKKWLKEVIIFCTIAGTWMKANCLN